MPPGCGQADATALRFAAGDPDLEDLNERYRELHRARGNDLTVGVERYACRAPVFRVPPGVRPPSWAARAELAYFVAIGRRA
jgi:hypothetical protein